MKVIQVTKEMDTLPLGRLGENERTKFVFDVNDWLEEYPGASIGLMARRPHVNSSYPVILSDEGEGKYGWTVTSGDLSAAGEGKCQLKAIENSVVVKSRRYNTHIEDALDGQDDPPAEWESWLDAIQRAAEIAIIKDGKLRFAINSDGHLVMSYTEDVPIDGEGDSSTTEDDVTWIHKDLGPVEAYAQAVAGGYTGTKAEWIAEIANASTNAQSAASSAEAAETAKIAAQEAAETASAAYNVNLLAPDYSNAVIYRKGDFVIYSGGFHRAKVDFEAAESWTAAHWEQITFNTVVRALQDKVNYLLKDVGLEIIDFTDGGYINITPSVGSVQSLTPVTSSEYSYAIHDVEPGQKIKIEHIYTNDGANYIYSNAILNSNNELLSVGSGGDKTNLNITIPSNGAKLVINARRSGRGLCYVGTGFIKDEKANKVTSGGYGNIAEIGLDGGLANSGHMLYEYAVKNNTELNGGLTLGKGTADETTITAAQLAQLLALIQ